MENSIFIRGAVRAYTNKNNQWVEFGSTDLLVKAVAERAFDEHADVVHFKSNGSYRKFMVAEPSGEKIPFEIDYWDDEVWIALAPGAKVVDETVVFDPEVEKAIDAIYNSSWSIDQWVDAPPAKIRQQVEIGAVEDAMGQWQTILKVGRANEDGKLLYVAEVLRRMVAWRVSPDYYAHNRPRWYAGQRVKPGFRGGWHGVSPQHAAELAERARKNYEAYIQNTPS